MKNTVKALSPNEVLDLKGNLIPDYVIESVNQLLVEKSLSSNGLNITLKQYDIIERIKENANKEDITIDSTKIYNLGYLNFESIFEEQGWKVEYDKPAYNESYESSFKFSPKK